MSIKYELKNLANGKAGVLNGMVRNHRARTCSISRI